MKPEYLTYTLVFFAVFGVLWVIWSTAEAAGMAEGEKRDFDNNLRSDGRQKTPLERFVSPGRLFRLKLAFSLGPAMLLPALFLVSGFANPIFLLVFASAVGFAGWRIVSLYYDILVRRRHLDFENGVLDFAAGLANALRAGMALPQAMERIAERMDGAMKEELTIVLREYRLGLEMPDALERLVERMPCEDMRLLASSVRLTTKTGGSLAEVLQEMVDMIRARREFSEKVKTLSAQGRFEGYVLGAMPVIAFALFYVIQPDLMSVLFKTMVGWTAIGVALLLETIGFLVISRITDIKV